MWVLGTEIMTSTRAVMLLTVEATSLDPFPYFLRGDLSFVLQRTRMEHEGGGGRCHLRQTRACIVAARTGRVGLRARADWGSVLCMYA